MKAFAVVLSIVLFTSTSWAEPLSCVSERFDGPALRATIKRNQRNLQTWSDLESAGTPATNNRTARVKSELCRALDRSVEPCTLTLRPDNQGSAISSGLFQVGTPAGEIFIDPSNGNGMKCASNGNFDRVNLYVDTAGTGRRIISVMRKSDDRWNGVILNDDGVLTRVSGDVVTGPQQMLSAGDQTIPWQLTRGTMGFGGLQFGEPGEGEIGTSYGFASPVIASRRGVRRTTTMTVVTPTSRTTITTSERPVSY